MTFKWINQRNTFVQLRGYCVSKKYSSADCPFEHQRASSIIVKERAIEVYNNISENMQHQYLRSRYFKGRCRQEVMSVLKNLKPFQYFLDQQNKTNLHKLKEGQNDQIDGVGFISHNAAKKARSEYLNRNKTDKCDGVTYLKKLLENSFTEDKQYRKSLSRKTMRKKQKKVLK